MLLKQSRIAKEPHKLLKNLTISTFKTVENYWKHEWQMSTIKNLIVEYVDSIV